MKYFNVALEDDSGIEYFLFATERTDSDVRTDIKTARAIANNSTDYSTDMTEKMEAYLNPKGIELINPTVIRLDDRETSEIKGTFTSIWSGGVVITPATLDLATGEVFAEAEETDDMGDLIEETFRDKRGETYHVCPVCHEFILKTIMDEGIGNTLVERKVCSNPDCENQ